LLILWPGMLLAPVFDRSALRWLVRGICGIYLLMFSVYYFHDRTPRWLETVVVGQRLLQVALPVWIVSYAGVVDDWIATPLRRRLGERSGAILTALACAGLITSCVFVSAQHQGHLSALLEARDELVAHVPEGSLIVYRGDLYKLLSIPVNVPSLRLRALEFHGKPADDPRVLFRDLQREAHPWTFAVLHRHPGEPLSDSARGLIERFALKPIPVRSPLLSIYTRPPAPQGGFILSGRARLRPSPPAGAARTEPRPSDHGRNPRVNQPWSAPAPSPPPPATADP